MTANTDALNQMIIGMADGAGAGALALADLNIQMGEMEPAAARALVAATVAQTAIQQLVTAWKGGEIDTSQLLASVDAVIAELQNKDLPTIELEIEAKKSGGQDALWHNLPLEERQIPIEADLTPAEEALGAALGLVTGIPDADRTIKILADYEAVTSAIGEIPTAISGISAEARTIEFVPESSAVRDEIASLDGSHLTIYVDYKTGSSPTPPGNAVGGPVSGGMPYIVGEVGPELFVPWTSGSIIPNHRIGGGGMQLSIQNYFYGPTSAAEVARATDTAGRRLLERISQAGVAV